MHLFLMTKSVVIHDKLTLSFTYDIDDLHLFLISNVCRHPYNDIMHELTDNNIILHNTITLLINIIHNPLSAIIGRLS